MSNFTMIIDDKPCMGRNGDTILTVAKENGIEIPTLCHHPLVKIYGACGICLVEAEGAPKLMRACATEAREGMVIHTRSQRAENARKLGLELLLSDHRGDCRPPCTMACPGHIDCQGYVGLIANGEYKEALKLIKEQLPLPASIGRVCPHPCEDACRRKLVEEPISICALKRFVGDFDLEQPEQYLPKKEPATGKSVAIIGGGPGGLTMAYYLAQKGHKAEIFEAMPKAGGMLRYGIPQYRLPKEVLDQEIALIEAMGVTMTCNTRIGEDISFASLEEQFDAVYIAIGAWKSAPMHCEGEDAQGVLGGIDFLIDVAKGKEIKLGKSVGVIGGGNTAMDACRTAMRLGAEKVYLLYRRTQSEMPAEDIEIAEAMEEGVVFKFLVSPTKILTEEGKVKGVELQQMALGEPDAGGRRRPVPVENGIEVLELDTVIAAIGQKVVADGIPVALTDWQTIAADQKTYQTNRKGVFAGGDSINNGPGIAIAAIGHAKEAAEVIDSYLKGDIVPVAHPYLVTRDDMMKGDFADYTQEKRVEIKTADPNIRKNNFKEVADVITEAEAKAEASRCLECGCADYFECKLIRYSQEYNIHPPRLGGEPRKKQEADDHPYIERNADKCVLCGLCVRVCEEVTGAVALGLVNRGFDTLVKPEFGKALADTDCISCGQCVNLCPTGALIEKWPLGKRVPIAEDKVPSVCGKCGLGCKTEVAVKGNTLCRVLPAENGFLCKEGKFGFGAEETNRLKTAKINGKEVPLLEGIKAMKSQLANLVNTYGKDAVAVLVSPKLTIEEMAAVKALGKDVLQTSCIGSLDESQKLPEELPKVSYDAINNADSILYLGEDLMITHPVLGMKLRMAKKSMALISNTKSLLDDTTLLKAEDMSLPFLKEVAKSALPDSGAELEGAELSQKAQAIGMVLRRAENPMVIWDKETLSWEGRRLIAQMGQKLGCKNLLELKGSCNSAGFEGFHFLSKVEITEALTHKKAVLAVGESLKNLDTSAFQWVGALSVHDDESLAKADIALPFAPFTETTGTFINSEGKEQQLNAVKASPFGMSNCEILAKLL